VSRTPLTTEQILNALAEAPRRIGEITAGLPEAQLQAYPAEGEWSANQVLVHLRSCADVWGNCIVTILNQDQPSIRALDPRTWTKCTNYPDLEFTLSLDAYTWQRNGLLDILRLLRPDTWLRTATVTGAGKPLERTVHFYAQWLAHHEKPHLKQIRNIACIMQKY
jgi:hypothetical protein